MLDLLTELIARFEGLRLKAYLCPAGVWTIGYGHTGGVKMGDTISAQQADVMLEHDAAIYAAAALKLSPILAQYPTRHAAIADFCYNLGTSRYKASTLRRRVNVGDWDGAARELEKWVWGGGKRLPGLVKRRAVEADLISTCASRSANML